METLEHNGATYVKVSVLAKRFNYTTDYIGQLCRQGKVEAKLVGRSWFVRESSLLDHGSDRLKVTRPAEILCKISVHTDTASISSPVSVFPQLSKHSHRHLLSGAHSVPFATDSSLYSSVLDTKYTPDTTASLPKFNYLKPIVQPVPVAEPVVLPQPVSQKISIHTETKRTEKLYFSSLPEVSLQGNLAIHNLDVEDDYVDSVPVVSEAVPFRPPVTRADISKSRSVVAQTVPPRQQLLSPRPLVQQSDAKVLPQHAVRLVHSKSAASRSKIPFFIPLMFLLSCTIAATLLSLSSLVESNGSVLNQSLQFNLAQVMESLSVLR